MCQQTVAGLVQSVGKISLEVPNDLPEFLQNFRYVIFKEEEDMLGLVYHAVCIDLVLDSRAASPSAACKGLKDSVNSFLKVTLKYVTDKSIAYGALIEQKENRDETRELVYAAHNEVLARNRSIFHKELRPHCKDLYDSVFLDFQEEMLSCRYTNFYSFAYSEEELRKLYKPEISPDDKLKNIIISNYYLSLYNTMQNHNKRRALKKHKG
jgi:hypothetical protein